MPNNLPTTVPPSNHDDAPLIPDYHDAETTFEYRALIAAALGFEDERLPSGLYKDILLRLHALLVASTPQPNKTVTDYRAEIAEELDLGDVDRYRENPLGFDRYKLVQIVDELKTYTQADLAEVIAVEDTHSS